MLVIDRRIRISPGEIEFRFARSSGPGGQNVNKVNSKAILRWPIDRSAGLPEDVRRRFRRRFARRITRDGVLVLTGQRYRDQKRNVADCLDKLRGMLEEVAAEPTPRRRTRPGPAARERRLGEKRLRAETKHRRQRVAPSRDD